MNKQGDRKLYILRLIKRVIELMNSKNSQDKLIAQALLVDVAKEINKL